MVYQRPVLSGQRAQGDRRSGYGRGTTTVCPTSRRDGRNLLEQPTCHSTLLCGQVILLRSSFLFVGFVSRKHKDALPSVSDDIVQADKQLIQELVHTPA